MAGVVKNVKTTKRHFSNTNFNSNTNVLKFTPSSMILFSLDNKHTEFQLI